MIKLKHLILENEPKKSRSRELSQEEFNQLLKTEYSEAYIGATKKFYRGMKQAPYPFMMTIPAGEDTRKSTDAKNYYNYLTKMFWTSYPDRTNSIIFTDNVHIADGFGANIYRVFPKNGVKLGVAPNDFTYTFGLIEFKNNSYFTVSQTNFETLMEDIGIPSYPYTAFVSGVDSFPTGNLYKAKIDKLGTLYGDFKMIADEMRNFDNIKDFLTFNFKNPAKFGMVRSTPKSLSKDTNREANEVWTDQPCIMKLVSGKDLYD